MILQPSEHSVEYKDDHSDNISDRHHNYLENDSLESEDFRYLASKFEK